MKKIFLMMALAATALFTTTACGGDDDDDNGNGGGGSSSGIVTLTPPPFKSEARVVNLEANDEGIRQLRLMESGTFMIAIENEEARATRSVDLVNCFFEFGKYTYSNGVFTFSNGMTISFAGQSGNNVEVTIKWKNGTTIKTTGTIDTSNAVTPGVMTDNLCSHAWTIEKVVASGKVEGIRVGKEFQGPIDLAKVKEWYEDKFKTTLKDEFDANTIIEGIYFDTHGLFTINYKNRKDDVGVWRWTDMNAGKLVYTWSDELNAISLFSGDASVEFSKNPDTCKLTLKGNVSNYDVEFLFTLK